MADVKSRMEAALKKAIPLFYGQHLREHPIPEKRCNKRNCGYLKAKAALGETP